MIFLLNDLVNGTLAGVLKIDIGCRCPLGLNREAGVMPARSRHCDGGAASRYATGTVVFREGLKTR
ncbi:hypothetical protein SRRS_11130 [Sporomusa rhizae]